MSNKFQKFVISQVAVLIRDGKCLVLEIAEYPGRWCLPGGRIDEGELSEEALARELKEEINIGNFKNLGLVSYDIWYPNDDIERGVCALVFLIENNDAEIKLSTEHLGYRWISESEVEDINFFWSSAIRMIESGFERYKSIHNNNVKIIKGK